MRIALAPVAVPFAAFTGWVILRVGYLGFWEWLLATPMGWQILADITIALFLVSSWIRRDAQAAGRRYWPYVALTVALGSIGPLAYLLLRPRAAAERPSSVARAGAS
jgi:hypothetical protein